MITKQHVKTRNSLRIVGPILILIGVILIIWGISGLSSSMKSYRQDMFGRYEEASNSMFTTFLKCALGLIMIGIGSALTRLGFMGKMARYVSSEISPVAKDTFNYMADGTRDGIKSIASAIKEGLTDSNEVICPACHKKNEVNDVYCSQCGYKLR